MSLIKSIGLVALLMMANHVQAQEWSKGQHIDYLDSIKDIASTLGAEDYNELLFFGIEHGAESYPLEHIDYLFKIINNYFRLGERDSMNAHMELALHLINSSERGELWRWYMAKGNALYDIPKIDSASWCYIKSIEEVKRYGLIENMPSLLNNLASASRDLAKLDTAKILAEKSIRISDSLDQKRPLMNARVILANIYVDQNDYSKAASLYNDAYDASKKGDLGVSHIYNSNNMGRLFIQLGQYSEAAKYFEEALMESKKFNQKRTIGPVYLFLADVLQLSGDYGKAKNVLLELEAESLEFTGLVHELHQILLAKSALSENKLEASLLILDKTFDANGDFDRLPYRTDLFLCRAEIAYRSNDLKKANEMCAKGVENYKARLTTGVQLYELQSRIQEEQENYKEALLANRQRNILADSLFSLNEIGIQLIQQVKTDLSQSEIAMNDLAEDYAKIEFEKQRQVNIIIGLVAGIISMAIFSFFYSRNRKLQLEKDLTDVKQQLLRIQINPHFIFNVLNSIQSSFLLEDQEKTIYLFNKFSNLMRQVLENSTSSFIPLNQELELLINYMEIEKGRTNNKFDYKVDIDGDVDIYLEEVPTMVLQIFVENSIWHGVVPKEKRGLISLQISKEADTLKIAIVDDGVGRSFSLSHKSKDQREKKSMGTDLVLQRLQLLNRKFGRNIGIAIADGPNSLGTRVELAV